MPQRTKETTKGETDGDDIDCDWCHKEAKTRRYLVLGLYGEFALMWGKGHLLCKSCLKGMKRELFKVRFEGRRMYGSHRYYRKYWKDEPRVNVLRIPKIDADESDDDVSAWSNFRQSQLPYDIGDEADVRTVGRIDMHSDDEYIWKPRRHTKRRRRPL